MQTARRPVPTFMDDLCFAVERCDPTSLITAKTEVIDGASATG